MCTLFNIHGKIFSPGSVGSLHLLGNFREHLRLAESRQGGFHLSNLLVRPLLLHAPLVDPSGIRPLTESNLPGHGGNLQGNGNHGGGKSAYTSSAMIRTDTRFALCGLGSKR